jgi:hypothetical protein
VLNAYGVRNRGVALLAIIVALWLCACAASAAPLYHITPLGLNDAEHRRYNGDIFTTAREINEAGQVLGSSRRFNGGNSFSLGLTHWVFNGVTTVPIGFKGPEYTRADGFQGTAVIGLNETGQVAGYQSRFNGGSTSLATIAWLYDGTTTIDISLTGPEYTRNDGYTYNAVTGLNETGQVAGYSYRYNGGSTQLGTSAWLFNGTSRTFVGLTDSEHTRDGGGTFNRTWSLLNESGQVTGYSSRYNGGSTDLGQSAWLYNGTTTIPIGLTGPEHTRSDGYKTAYLEYLNEAGHVVGSSTRYNGGSTYLGAHHWLYNGTTTIPIGLTDVEHTSDVGLQWGSILKLNEAGQVAGYASRYVGTYDNIYNPDNPGRSAWFFNGTTTLNIGFTGPEYSRADGYKFSNTTDLNEAGQVIGWSRRYNGGNTDLGITAWLHNGSTTIELGFTGPEYTRTDGVKLSGVYKLNEVGQAIGISVRANGNLWGVDTPWLYDGTTTIPIGLTGSVYTTTNGQSNNQPEQLNEAGQVTGYTWRFNGGSTYLGQDAWFYDPSRHQTTALRLSTRSDGYAYSVANYLGEDGLVLGTYTLYDALDRNLGNRAFYFTIADGLHDLGVLVDGGLTANGWSSLASVLRTNGQGQILGHGRLTSQTGGQMAYLLTPIPEPSTFILVTVALGFCTARRRRSGARLWRGAEREELRSTINRIHTIGAHQSSCRDGLQELPRRHDSESQRAYETVGQLQQVTGIRDEVRRAAGGCDGQQQIVVRVAAFGVPAPQPHDRRTGVRCETSSPLVDERVLHAEQLAEYAQVFIDQIGRNNQLQSLRQQPQPHAPLIGTRPRSTLQSANEDVGIEDDGNALFASNHAPTSPRPARSLLATVAANCRFRIRGAQRRATGRAGRARQQFFIRHPLQIIGQRLIGQCLGFTPLLFGRFDQDVPKALPDLNCGHTSPLQHWVTSVRSDCLQHRTRNDRATLHQF